MTAKIPIHATYNGSDSDGLAEYQSTESIQVDKGLTLNKSSLLYLDAEGSYGWGDITAEITIRGASGPNFVAITGLGNLYAHEFPGNADKEVFLCFHMPHTYAEGTDIYFHTHWLNATATPSTNNVVWGFEYTIAKGHGQQAFPAPSTITVTTACSATRYMHHITETTAISSANLEPDSLIYVRAYRPASSDAADTNANSVFLLTCDVHYQMSRFATKNRAPAFNV